MGEKVNEEEMEIEEQNIATPRKKKVSAPIKKTTPIKKKKDEFY